MTRSSQFESPRKVSSIMGKKSNQIQIFIILVSAPFRRYELVEPIMAICTKALIL